MTPQGQYDRHQWRNDTIASISDRFDPNISRRKWCVFFQFRSYHNVISKTWHVLHSARQSCVCITSGKVLNFVWTIIVSASRYIFDILELARC